MEYDELLHEISGGSPGFLEKSIQLLLLRKSIFQASEGWVFQDFSKASFPKTWDELVDAITRELDNESVQIIQNACLLGADCCVKALSEITGKNEKQVETALKKAFQTGILSEEKEGLKFSSTSFEKSYYNHLDPKIREQLHAPIGALLEKIKISGRSADLNTLLFHFSRGNIAEKKAIYVQQCQQRNEGLFDPKDVFDDYNLEVEQNAKKYNIFNKTLSEEEIRMFREWINHFLTAVRQSQLYPVGSAMCQKFLDPFCKITEKVFGRLEGFALKIVGRGIHLNTIELIPKQTGDYIGELISLLKKRHISSLFFTKSGREEISKFIEVLSTVTEDFSLDNQHWSKILLKNDVTSITILKQAYLELEGNGESSVMSQSTDVHAETVWDDESISNMRIPSKKDARRMSSKMKFKRCSKKFYKRSLSRLKKAFLP